HGFHFLVWSDNLPSHITLSGFIIAILLNFVYLQTSQKHHSFFQNTTYCLEIIDRKSTRLNSSHVSISYAVFCLKKKTALTISTAQECANVCAEPFGHVGGVGEGPIVQRS